MYFSVPSYQVIYRNGLLFVLVLLGIAAGIWDCIVTPTLPNLKEKLNVPYETLGKILSMTSLGNIVSLGIVGYVYDSYPAYIPYLMFAECLVAGICTIIIPWCRQFWLAALLFFIQSGAQSALVNGCQLTVIKTFKDKAVGKIQIYHLGWGTGSLLSGIIAQPFLPKTLSYKAKVTKYCEKQLGNHQLENITGFNSVSNNSLPIFKQETSFEYIYLISGIIAIIISFIFLFYNFLRNPDDSKVEIKTKESWIKNIHPKYTANGKIFFGTTMTILLFFYYFFYLFGLLNFQPYLIVYAIDPCKKYSMSQKNSAYFFSVVNACFLVGRIIGSFVLDLKTSIMILVFNFFNVIFVLILVLFSNQYVIALWIGACGMRFCNSIVYPAGTSNMNRFIIITSTLISIAFLGGTCGSFMGQLTGGFIIDNYPSYYILIICCLSMMMLFMVTLTITILGHRNGLRDFSNEASNKNKDSKSSQN